MNKDIQIVGHEYEFGALIINFSDDSVIVYNPVMIGRLGAVKDVPYLAFRRGDSVARVEDGKFSEQGIPQTELGRYMQAARIYSTNSDDDLLEHILKCSRNLEDLLLQAGLP